MKEGSSEGNISSPAKRCTQKAYISRVTGATLVWSASGGTPTPQVRALPPALSPLIIPPSSDLEAADGLLEVRVHVGAVDVS